MKGGYFKKILVALILLFTISFTFAAPNPGVGTGIQSTGGYGKYKGAIYWLSWGRDNNEQIQNGDKSIFTTPNGIKYEVTISDITFLGANPGSGSHNYLEAVYPESSQAGVWGGGNSFPYAYNFDQVNADGKLVDAGGNVIDSDGDGVPDAGQENNTVPLQDHTGAIGINAVKAKMSFRLNVQALRPNPNYGQPGEPEYIETTSNVILAGSEDLGKAYENYSLTTPITNSNGNPTAINVIETYLTATQPFAWGDPLPRPGPFRGRPTDQQWGDFNLQIDVSSNETLVDNGVSRPARKITASNDQGSFHGDAMFIATNTNIVDVNLSASGGQSIAIGVLDLLDGGDAPALYEDTNLAQHSSVPKLTTGTLSDNAHYLVGLEAKNNFTSQDGSTVEEPIPHIMKPELRIGQYVDFETKVLNSADAQGDDNEGGLIEGQNDDEDGVHTLITGCEAIVDVANETDNDAYLHYWVDKDNNTSFDYTDYTPNLTDQEYGRITVPAQYYNPALPGNIVKEPKEIEVPVNNLYSPTTKQERLMRFRISHQQDLKHSGIDMGGEIEDTFVTFLNPRPEISDVTLTCGNPTAPVKVIDLPTTGWQVTIQKKQANGTYVNEGTPVNGSTEETTFNLVEGEYKMIAGSFVGVAPASCQKEQIFTVQSDCVAPTASDDTASTPENTAVNIDVTSNDTVNQAGATIDPISVTITTQPQHGTLSINPTTGVVTYTPTSGYTGTDTFQYTVKDSNGKVSNIATATITIQKDTDGDGIPDTTDPDDDNDGNPDGTDPHPLVPTTADDTDTAKAGIAKTTDILANDDFLPGNNTSLTDLGTGTAQGTVSLNPATGELTYTPTQAEVGSTVTVKYQVCNTLPNPDVCEAATASITVTSNDAPVINTHNDTINQGGTFNLLDLVDSASDTEDTNLDKSDVTITNDGGFDPNTPGTYTITFTVTDSDNNTTTKTATVTVNAPPIANDDAKTTTQNTAVDIDVKVNDTDNDGTIDPTSITITTQPQHGTLAVNPTTGIVTYTPINGYTGTDMFQYTIADNTGAVSNVAIVNLTVAGSSSG